MSGLDIAIIVNRLGEHWLGGVNYYRNLVEVFDAAAESGLRLHVLTDDSSFLKGLSFSSRVVVHQLPMLQRKSAAWAVRQTLLVASGKDLQLVSALVRLKIRAVFLKYVAGARESGIFNYPWIHDFQSQYHPELFAPALVKAEKKNAYKYVRRADGLILSSQAACEDAVRHFGAQRGNVHVLRFAPKLDLEALRSTSLRDDVFDRYNVTHPYIFLPNQYWKHKNHRLVIDALIRLRDEKIGLPLILSTGRTEDGRDSAYFSEFESHVRNNGLGSHYRILGVIPRDDMLTLMAHALAVINPSRFEGWSTTVEEAKALGKRLLVSDIAVHHEQTAGLPGAMTFPTDDSSALAALMADLQQRHQHDTARSHPPKPDPSYYAAFTEQFIWLLKRLSNPCATSK